MSAPRPDEMSEMARSLWNDLHDLFDVDDGSLPEVRVNFVEISATPDGYALLRKRAAKIVTDQPRFWSKLHGEERPLDSVPNAAALVVSGDAESFHVVLGGLEANEVVIPDIGVCVFPDQLALDYRMKGWDAAKVEALFQLLFELSALDSGSSLSLEEGVARSVAARFQRAWERFVAERTATMSTKLSVEFSPPKHGWIQLALRSGDQKLLVAVSHVPFDSLEEIASAVSTFLEAGRQGVAHFNCESEEYDLLFESGVRPGALRVKAILYPRGRRASGPEVVWLHEGDAIQIGRTIWRALRKLESRFSSENWTHSFPSKIVGGLERLTAEAG